jgi:uncharacterized protein YjiS (DUF1127 family)
MTVIERDAFSVHRLALSEPTRLRGRPLHATLDVTVAAARAAAGTLRAMIGRMRVRRARAANLKAFERLDDRTLEDIGLSRFDVP